MKNNGLSVWGNYQSNNYVYTYIIMNGNNCSKTRGQGARRLCIRELWLGLGLLGWAYFKEMEFELTSTLRRLDVNYRQEEGGIGLHVSLGRDLRQEETWHTWNKIDSLCPHNPKVEDVEKNNVKTTWRKEKAGLWGPGKWGT